jgi:tricorn protease
MRRARLSLTAILFAAGLSASAMAAELGYFRQPAISNSAIVFVAEGDLWRTDINGGAAQRLTSHAGEENNPSISPDGRWLAFTGRYEGPAEVYVMPLAGGVPVRLTYEGDNARVQGWMDDGKVLYSSLRYAGKPNQRLLTVDTKTRAITPVPLSEAAEGCMLGGILYFARQPQLGDNARRYEGGAAQKLWRFDGKSEAVPLTADFKGTSRQPMCGVSRVYFLSDRDGVMNVWSMNPNGGDLKQHTEYRDYDVRGASLATGTDKRERIAFQRGADIHVLDTATNQTQTLIIKLQSDFDHVRTRWIKNPWDLVTDIAPSPTGERVAITARGQVFVVAAAGAGRRVEVTRVSDTRARRAIFSHDGKSVYAFADRSGEVELWRYPANGTGEGRQLTRGAKVLRERAYPSPDGKWIAHTDKDRNLYLYDVAAGTDRAIDRSARGAYEEIEWSPDSRWIVFGKNSANQFSTLFAFEIAAAKLTALTSDRYHARSPAFSPDGKWLYFLSDRNLQSLVTSPWGQRNPEPFFDRQAKIYAFALDPAARWPFLPRDELQRTEPEKKDGPPAGEAAKADGKAPAAAAPQPAPQPPKASAIVLDGITSRLYEVPVPAGNLSELSTDGKRLYFLLADTAVERKLHVRSVAIEPAGLVPLTVDTFFDDVRSYALTQDRKKILIRKANELFVFDAGKSAPPPLEQAKFAVNLRDWTFAVDPRDEWKQMFIDAWRMHRDQFVDKNMHGVDWVKNRAKYEPLLARITDRSELNDVIAQMIAELGVLHSQVFTADLRRGADAIDVGGLAADTEKKLQGFRITKLHNGDIELIEERGPLARAEVNVKVGDTITGVNGIGAANAASLGELMRNQVGRQVLLSVLEAAGRSREVIVTPVDARRDRELRYLAWERERGVQADRASGGRIGYVHLQAMGGADIARWAREFYPVFQREGLIIDLRRNGGGSIDSWIIEKLQRRAWHFWQSRDADEPFSNQQLAFRGHVVAIVDGDTYSDGETMAQGLRKLGIATLIGTTTSGAGIWLSDQNRLRDNGIARAAESGSFIDDGKERRWITEGLGVTPDIIVDNPPFATYNGADAQLDAAIGYLMDKIKKEPMQKPSVPAMPVRGN